MNNVIFSINGPVVTVRNSKDFSMLEMVYVGNKRLIGEVIGVNDQATTIQVYESTTGLCPGEPVEPTGAPMSATLGPGILSNIFDGIERPLKKIAEESGAFIRKEAIFPLWISIGNTMLQSLSGRATISKAEISMPPARRQP